VADLKEQKKANYGANATSAGTSEGSLARWRVKEAAN
jgi:hypothetical protein